MQSIQVRLTEKQLENLDKVVSIGVYPSRSEAVRNILNNNLIMRLVDNGNRL